MKKFLTFFLVIAVFVTGVFAAEPAITDKTPSSIYSAEPYMPLSPKTMGMGGAGVATPLRTDSFFMNPAGLAMRNGHKFQLSLPFVDVKLFNVYKMVKPGPNGEKSILDQVIDMTKSSGQPDYSKLIGPVLELFPAGHSKIATVDAGISFVAGGFGLSFNAGATVHDYGKDKGGASSELFAEIESAISMGYAYNIKFTDSFSLAIGGIVRFNVIAYSGMLGADDVLKEAQGGTMMNLVTTLPIAAGWAVSGDVGLQLHMPAGFKFGAVARNFSTDYKMQVFDNYEGVMAGFGNIFKNEAAIALKQDWSLDLGIGWAPENSWFKPTVSADLVDVIGLFSGKENLKEGRTWISHLKAGIDLRVLSFLEIRGGINRGYWSLGAGIDIGILNVEAAYFVQEMGEHKNDTIGNRSLDALQIRVNVGFDR